MAAEEYGEYFFGWDILISGCQWVKITENGKGFVVRPKTNFLYFTFTVFRNVLFLIIRFYTRGLSDLF